MQNVKSILVLVISVLFIAAGSVNQGITSFYMSLPFVAAFVYALKFYSLTMKVSVIVVVAILILPLAWEHEENRLIYPWIGDDFIASCGWKSVKYEKNYTGYSYATLIPKEAEIDERYVISQHPVPCDSAWKLIRVFVQHPDLGTTYHPVFFIAGLEATMSDYVLDEAFKSQTIKHSKIDSSHELQSELTYNLSLLMMWPTIPIRLLSSGTDIFFHYRD